MTPPVDQLSTSVTGMFGVCLCGLDCGVWVFLLPYLVLYQPNNQ